MDRRDSGYVEMDHPEPPTGTAHKGVLGTLSEEEQQPSRPSKNLTNQAEDSNGHKIDSPFLSQDESTYHKGIMKTLPDEKQTPRTPQEDLTNQTKCLEQRDSTGSKRDSVSLNQDESTCHKGTLRTLPDEKPAPITPQQDIANQTKYSEQRGSLGSKRDSVSLSQDESTYHKGNLRTLSDEEPAPRTLQQNLINQAKCLEHRGSPGSKRYSVPLSQDESKYHKGTLRTLSDENQAPRTPQQDLTNQTKSREQRGSPGSKRYSVPLSQDESTYHKGVIRTLSDAATRLRDARSGQGPSQDTEKMGVTVSSDLQEKFVLPRTLESVSHQAVLRTCDDPPSISQTTSDHGVTHSSESQAKDTESESSNFPNSQGGSVTVSDNGSSVQQVVLRTHGDQVTLRGSKPALCSKVQSEDPEQRLSDGSLRDSVFFNDDSVDYLSFSDSCDNTAPNELGTDSVSQRINADRSGYSEKDNNGNFRLGSLKSPDNFVSWEDPVGSPSPKQALLRSNSVSLPVTPADHFDDDTDHRMSVPVFQFSLPKGELPSIGITDINARGQNWSSNRLQSKSETDLLLIEEADISSTYRKRLSAPPARSHSSGAASKNSLATFINRTYEGHLWLNNTLQRTQVKRWCIIHRETLLMFESNHPQSKVLEQWRLAECKVTDAPRKIQLDLFTRFSAHHAFQIKRSEKKSTTIFSALTDYLCKEWKQKLTTASSIYWKGKGSRLSFPSFSLRAHFAKQAGSSKQKNKELNLPKMSKQSFADIYGWAEQQSHRRVQRASPVQQQVIRLKERRKSQDLFELVRAHSDSQLAQNKTKKEPVDRSTSEQSWKNFGDKFGSIRRTLKKLPQGKLGPPSPSSSKKKLKASQSTPLEPSVRAGRLLVKRHTSWNRCWVKLHSGNLHFFSDRNELRPFEVVSLVGYTVQYTPPSHSQVGQVRFKFSLMCEGKESIHFLADTELEGKLWVKRFMEACTSDSMGTLEKSPSSILTKSGDFLDDSDHNSNDNNHSDASLSPSESPLLRQRRLLIQKKYEQANETEEMNAMKRSLILNQRRMSTQTKINALDKQYLGRMAQKGKKRGGNKQADVGCDIESIKKLLKELELKVAGIDRELNENVLRTDQRRQALRKKQEMELEILQQERELLRCRSRAQAVLKNMMYKSGSQKLPSPLVEEREFDPDSIDSGNFGSESMGGSYGQLQKKRNSPSMSSSMSSLSSSSTSESSGSSLHSNSRYSPRVGRPANHSMDSIDGSGLSRNHPLREGRYNTPAVSTPDLRGINDRIPENGYLYHNESVEAPAVLITPEIRPKRRTEVPPDVLRDIDEFEEMAKLALRKAGWLPSDPV